MAEILRDIIDIPDVKLVIELDDADNDPEGITTTFVFTGEIRDSIDIILKRISRKEGCGTFVKGNFGSGKSHFLSYLFLLLKNGLPLLDEYPDFKGRDMNVIKISLVKYPAARTLEGIILSCLGYDGDVVNRDEIFRKLVSRETVIIIDELSEFLRSKPSPPAFYEDIRFLQFLGEFSFHNPLWVIASLQEWIEETGHISSNIFNRIKDRFPLRINLTSSHIEDIIDNRIILKKRGAEESIKGVFFELKKYYPYLQLKYDDFRKTYPLHPFTVRFLSGLTPVFSQHRGVIHFVFSEVRKILDGPIDMLITPDAIFDHFQERIREIPEYSPLVRVVYDYYKSHVGEIMPQTSQKETALSAIKILILSEVSPFEKRKTAGEIAEILLKKISTLTSQINYEFIKEGVLDPLASHQMYINKEGDRYYIDPRVDEGIRIKGRIKALREKFEDRVYLFSEICRLLNLSYLPLTDLKEAKKYKFLWQNSLRECVAFVSLPGQLTRGDIERMTEGVEKRLDGYLVIFSPFEENRGHLYSLGDRFSSPFLSSLIFWTPRGLSEEEGLFIEEFIAKSRLLSEFPALRSETKKEDIQFRDIMTRVYFEGEIIYGSGAKVDNLKDIGYLPFEKLLAHLFEMPLAKLHPSHYQIMPKVDYFSSHHLANLFSQFIKQGKLTVDEAKERGLEPYIKGLLEPMGIIKGRSANLLVSLDVENELVSHVLNLASQEEDLANLKAALKNGRWGMGEEQINLLVSALIVSGHLVPYGREGMVEFRELSQLSTGGILKLRHGKTLPPDLLGYIRHGRFIWGEVEDVPTPLTRKMMWKETVALVRRGKELIKSIHASEEKYRGYSLFKKLSVNSPLLNRLSLFFNSLPVSLPPAEGLERTLSYLKDNPGLEEEMSYLEKVHTFFSEHFQLLTRYYLYLTHPSLKVPDNRLEETGGILLAGIEEYLASFKEDISSLKEKWEDFFEKFTTTYKELHGNYYQSPVFKIRGEADKSEEGRTLRRISNIVRSITFGRDWWEVKRELEKLPVTCREDLNYELFNAPVCKCNFRMGDEPPQVQDDFNLICSAGIINFLKVLHMPENREKLDTYMLSIRGTGREDVGGRLLSILNLNLADANISLLLPLLTDRVLEEIEKAFKGRWKIREVRARDFTDMVKGRRLKHSELRDMFFRWAGSDEETILWVRDEGDTGVDMLKEDLARYGAQGERLLQEITGGAAGAFQTGLFKNESMCDMEERLREDERLTALEGIKLASYSTDELFNLLKTEKITYLRKKLRGEIFHRLWGRIIGEEEIKDVEDGTMKDLLQAIRISGLESRNKGAAIFTNVIAPLNYLLEKMKYDNAGGQNVGDDVVRTIDERYNLILKGYEKSGEGDEGATDIEHLKSRLKGVVVILDGLRYDLWHVFRETLIEEGFRVKEMPFVIAAPTSTAEFRRKMGIGEEGSIDGRSYVLLKWAERVTGRRKLKNILKSGEDIKFLHFNFIDTKVHNSTLDLYPLYMTIKGEFISGILPILRELHSFYLISDHGFTDKKRLKNRYTHGGGSIWETVLPFAGIGYGLESGDEMIS